MEEAADPLRRLFDFAALVGVLRAKQKRFAVTKSQAALEECRIVERKVDAELRRIREMEQPKLFEGAADGSQGPH
jgi:hypothetical protein